MSELSRRGFLRGASIGAAAIGALSAFPNVVRAQAVGPLPLPIIPAVKPGQAAPLGANAPLSPMPVVVYFDELSSGKGRVFVGEQAIEFDNPMLVHSVQAVMG